MIEKMCLNCVALSGNERKVLKLLDKSKGSLTSRYLLVRGQFNSLSYLHFVLKLLKKKGFVKLDKQVIDKRKKLVVSLA